VQFSYYIARRYLVSKKSHNLINVISLISLVGLTVGTASLIIVLSVFNGFEDVVKSLYNSFNPDVEITARTGKTFHYTEFPAGKIKSIEGLNGIVEVVQEDALLKYRDQQYIAKIKGVSGNFVQLSEVGTKMTQGDFVLQEGDTDFALIGAGVAWYLGINIHDYRNLLSVYVPRRGNASTFNFETAFNNEVIPPSGVFAIQQEFDEKIVLVPLRYTRKLLDYNDEVTSVEIYLKDGTDEATFQKQLSNILGNEFLVKNRFQQNETLYKVMRSEKMAVFLILIFILILASFNMVGSLSILIVEKLKDIAVLKSMGADHKLIRRIFITEGMLISLVSAVAGLLIGFVLLFLQDRFGWLSLGQGDGSFIIDAYPVKVLFLDFLFVFLSVQVIGFLASWYPARFLTKKYASISLK
jgi:lipoprotein-releasing system permease protein